MNYFSGLTPVVQGGTTQEARPTCRVGEEPFPASTPPRQGQCWWDDVCQSEAEGRATERHTVADGIF
jgi:hypothetical protein